MLLEETLMNVESAAADVNVMKALSTGDQVLKDLQKQVSMADWEDLYDSHKDNLERHEMEQEMFGEVLDDAEMEAELDKLVELNAQAEMGNLVP